MAAGFTGPTVNRVVMDTCVVSLMFRGDDRADYYKARIAGLSPCISFQTLEELWFGACTTDWGARRKNDLARHLEQYDVVWPTEELVEVYAQLRCARQLAGRRLMTADAWIAATALMLKCPLASHDRDFHGISDLNLIRKDPFIPTLPV
ncbi:MAG: PIN domain-containing protein [Acidimicrobiaceae bacterium]|nr:PIN domain-containing protein [Acidimicrobiaceae bacterium]